MFKLYPAPVIKYTLTTAANPTTGGTISPASGQHSEGATVNITATPAAEHLFSTWTGATGTTATTSVIDKAKSVTAVFVKKQYALTIEIEGEGTVSEKVIKAGLATDYNSGTIVELTAVPADGWEFVEWFGDITSTENPVQITISEAKTVKAKFMRYFDYKVPSHDWENGHRPWMNVYLNGPSYSTVQLYNNTIGIHTTGFTDFTAQEGLNISTSGTANINGNTFSVGAQNFDFQGSHFQQSVNDSYTASIGGSYSVDAGNVTLKSNGDFKLIGDYISASGSTLDVTTNFVSIDSGTGPSQFVSGTDTTISASSSLNLTADEGNVTTGDGKGLQYTD